jgi:asparagine synthetase B (glutamine-hydrolysing)
MQMRFGVLGDAGHSRDEVFDGLVGASRDSNPGLTLDLEESPSVRIGYASRNHGSWREPGTDRAFYLEGLLRSIDGRPTTERGTGEADLRRLAELFVVHGDAIWERLDGSFCLVIVDGRTYHIGVDLVGTRGVYWWSSDGLLAFHSHLIDLAPTYPGTLDEDPGALGNYLTVGLYPATATAFREIRHLGAGQCLSFADGQVSARSHFEFVSMPDMPRRPKAILVDELIDLATEAVATSWRDARLPVVPLSGGIDSRYLVGEITRQNGPVARTITWGEDPTRPDSDAVFASRVSGTLGVEHTWFDKAQHHSPETFRRAVYLSSGEADGAIHYPGDHLLHADLAANHGFASLFRGDELFGTTSPLPILTTRGALALSSVIHMGQGHGYANLVDRVQLDRMSAEQGAFVDAVRRDIRSATPQGQRMEVLYGQDFRRELATYNVSKNADLEVYTPLLHRRMVEWLVGIPDDLKPAKPLLRAAMLRRFPELAAIPYATRSNLPDWRARSQSDPSFAAFLREWFLEPGWLDAMGTKPAVLAGVEEMGRVAETNAPSTDGLPLAPQPGAYRERVRKTVPGRLLRELTLERRYIRNVPPYLRLSRLAVLHGMLGQIEVRRARRPPIT